MTDPSADLLAALHSLLDQVLDLGPAEREVWLARLRIEQPAYAMELEKLLAEEVELDARQFLAGGVTAETLPVAGLAGQRLGAWTLERRVGQGGMGSVWLARRSDGRFEGTLLRAALAVNRRALGENHPKVADNIGNLAIIARDRSDLAEAERLLGQALVIDRRIYGPEHTIVAFDLNELASVLRSRGHPDSAVVLLRAALRQVRKLVGESHRNTLAVTTQLGRALRESGRSQEAEPLFRAALARFDSANADTRLLRFNAAIGLGRTLTGLGQPAEGLPLLQQVVAESRQHLGSEHWRTAEAELGLGECLLALRRSAAAEPLLRHAFVMLDADRRKQPLPAREAEMLLRRPGASPNCTCPFRDKPSHRLAGTDRAIRLPAATPWPENVTGEDT